MERKLNTNESSRSWKEAASAPFRTLSTITTQTPYHIRRDRQHQSKLLDLSLSQQRHEREQERHRVGQLRAQLRQSLEWKQKEREQKMQKVTLKKGGKVAKKTVAERRKEARVRAARRQTVTQ